MWYVGEGLVRGGIGSYDKGCVVYVMHIINRSLFGNREVGGKRGEELRRDGRWEGMGIHHRQLARG